MSALRMPIETQLVIISAYRAADCGSETSTYGY